MSRRKHKDYARNKRRIILKKEDSLLFILLMSIFMLQLSYTVLLNKYSIKGIELGDLRDQIAKEKVKNEVLRQEYLQYQSLGTIKEEADRLGMHEVTKSDYLLIK